MLHVNLRHFRPQLLQTVEQTAEAPCPLTIGTIILQFGIKTIEVMLTTLMMSAPPL